MCLSIELYKCIFILYRIYVPDPNPLWCSLAGGQLRAVDHLRLVRGSGHFRLGVKPCVSRSFIYAFHMCIYLHPLPLLQYSQVANCALWTTYGWFAVRDVFVWGPNLTGLLLGLAQLALKIAFPDKK